MFDEFADSEDFTRCAELLFDGVERVDGGLGPVCSVQIPGVESGEVLEGSEDLVAADCGC